MRVLFLEDDYMIASGLTYALEQEGYQVFHQKDVQSALKLVRGTTLDLGILDLGLPDGSGFTVCRELNMKNIPVIILTAADDEANTVRGLDMGADDYIAKPFRLKELLSRVNAVLRRYEAKAPQYYDLGYNIQLYPQQAMVLKNGVKLNLTSLEYRLLLTLFEHKGQVLSRAQLLNQAWDTDGNFVEDNTLTVYIRRLREKLSDSTQPELIKTVRGMGYRLD
ncbi:MAG: response regulator transcription factor [Clostridiales bacterium]|jgi:DNA-binding response OmpR family regulator|nr:response regulator transcription factor [Clostridiales bacterium]